MSDRDKKAGLLRLGVLISGGGRTLMNLLDESKAGRLPAEVRVVIASRPCAGLDKAKAAGLECHLVEYRKFKEAGDQAGYSARITELLDKAGAELVVMAGFLSLWHIPPQYEGRVINIHPALLPDFGGHGMFGHHVHEAVLKAGAKQSGCTVHFVTNEYDRGPIILQRQAAVLPGDTPDTLAARVFQQECLALPRAIRMIADGKIPIPGR
ncbi:MAG: phosphoribosylglycinamide formyltransferase [Planctomycetes bacterium]|nr:phosphoribosylglycinamide formyltransferase [Planctomycetota bacterium]